MTVLVASTNTPEGQAALAAAVEEAKRRGEDLLVFNLEGAHLHLEVDRLDDVPVIYRTPDAHNRDAVTQLLETAEQMDASAIVVGVKRRSPVGKLLLGSVAQQILLEAHVPVLAIKPQRF